MPVQYSFYKRRSDGVVDDEPSEISDVISIIKTAIIPDADAINAQRMDAFRKTQQEETNKCFLLNYGYLPVEEEMFDTITDIGDIVTNNEKWDEDKFNVVVNDQPDWFKKVTKFVLHEGYVYKAKYVSKERLAAQKKRNE